MTALQTTNTNPAPRFLSPSTSRKHAFYLSVRLSAVATLATLTLLIAAAAFPTQASAAPAAGVQAQTANVELRSGEQQLLNQLVGTRNAAGLGQLTIDPTLVAVARDRSADMANRGYFGHTTPEGKDFLAILRAWGVRYRMAGEIIAQNNFPVSQSPAEAHKGFLNSSGHKQVIMMNNWSRVGIGQAVDGRGMYYYTVIFVQPRASGN